MKLNNFHTDLAFSQEHKHEGFWQAIYEKAFPDMEWCKPCIGMGHGQYLGIDRIIYLSSGRNLLIDEKLRRKSYPDILLEYLSNDQTGSSGWIEKPLHIDYLAYAFLPERRCFLFDWQLLRRTWIYFREEWKANYYNAPAENEGYTTWSVCVPIKVLTKAVSRARIIELEEDFDE